MITSPFNCSLRGIATVIRPKATADLGKGVSGAIGVWAKAGLQGGRVRDSDLAIKVSDIYADVIFFMYHVCHT